MAGGSGMDFTAQITLTSALQSIVFNTYAFNGAGEKWFAELEGWDSAPRRPVTLDNQTGDGEFPVFGRMAPRPVTITGVIETTTVTLLKVAREKFMTACMMLPEVLGTLAVADPVATQASLYSASPPKWRIVHCQDNRAIAEFQAAFIAPDPRKYAQSLTTTALGAGIATPSPVATPSNTGGSLSASNLSYRVTAVNGSGETGPSTAVTLSFSPLATPGQPSLTGGTTGTLGFGAYAYRVAAVNASGETLASTEAVIGMGSGSNGSVTVAWAPVAGATGYNVYGRTISGELKITPTAITGTSFVDTGAATPSGALPSSNTTGTTTGSVVLAWSAITGATGYNVYGRTAGVELKMTPTPIVTLTFTDTGSVTPSGALPAGGAFSTTVTNSGDYPTRPVLTVVGSSTNPISLTIGSRTLEIGIALSGAQTLVVDMGANKSVKVNGVERLDLLANTSQWPELAAGANAVTYVGGGTASLGFRHAYA